MGLTRLGKMERVESLLAEAERLTWELEKESERKVAFPFFVAACRISVAKSRFGQAWLKSLCAEG